MVAGPRSQSSLPGPSFSLLLSSSLPSPSPARGAGGVSGDRNTLSCSSAPLCLLPHPYTTPQCLAVTCRDSRLRATLLHQAGRG